MMLARPVRAAAALLLLLPLLCVAVNTRASEDDHKLSAEFDVTSFLKSAGEHLKPMPSLDKPQTATAQSETATEAPVMLATTAKAKQVGADKLAPFEQLPSLAPHDGLDGDGFGPLANPRPLPGDRLYGILARAAELPRASSLVSNTLGSDLPLAGFRGADGMLPPLIDAIGQGGDNSAGAALLNALAPTGSAKAGSSASASASGSSSGGRSGSTAADLFSPFVSPMHPALTNSDPFGVPNFADPGIAPVLPAIPVPFAYSHAAGFVRGVPLPPALPVDPTLPAAWLKDFPVDHPLPPYMSNPLPNVPNALGVGHLLSRGALTGGFNVNAAASIFASQRAAIQAQRAAGLAAMRSRRSQISGLQRWVDNAELILAGAHAQASANPSPLVAQQLALRRSQIDSVKERLTTLQTLQREEAERVNRLNIEFRKAMLTFEKEKQERRAKHAAATAQYAQSVKTSVDQKLKALNDRLAAVGKPGANTLSAVAAAAGAPILPDAAAAAASQQSASQAAGAKGGVPTPEQLEVPELDGQQQQQQQDEAPPSDQLLKDPSGQDPFQQGQQLLQATKGQLSQQLLQSTKGQLSQQLSQQAPVKA